MKPRGAPEAALGKNRILPLESVGRATRRFYSAVDRLNGRLYHISDSVTLPPELIALRDACGGALEKLEEGRKQTEPLIRPFNYSTPIDLIRSGELLPKLESSMESMKGLRYAVKELERAMAIGKYDSTMVFSVMGRVEGCVNGLQKDFREGLDWRVRGEDVVGKNLLTASYRHTLEEIRAWLREVVESLDDPVAYATNRGLGPTDKAGTARVVTEPVPTAVDIPLALELTVSLEMESFQQWCVWESKRRQPRSSPPPRKRSSGGQQSLLLGVISASTYSFRGDDD